MRKSLTRISLASGLALAVIAGSSAFALPTQASTHAQNVANNSVSNSVGSGQGNSTRANQNKVNGLARACENRKAAITNIMHRIDQRGQNQLRLFTTIASRVEAFYVKSGKTVSNYSSLTSAIASASTTAEANLTVLNSNSTTFTCSSSNPKGMVTTFQGYLKTEISDLKNLKTAVKNLIVAVAQASVANVAASVASSAPLETTAYELAALYYGWNFNINPTAVLYSC